MGVAGVSVGIVSRRNLGTGITVILLPPGTVGAVDVSGGAPATRETDCLDPANAVIGPDAIVFSGGSAFGLGAAQGVMEVLADHSRGVKVGPHRVPIVCAAALYDLSVISAGYPTAADGRRATLRALASITSHVPEGAVGAGTGATVGKYLGQEHASPAGQGACTVQAADGLTVAAIVAVNAVGAVVDAAGQPIAGPIDRMGVVVPPLSALADGHSPLPGFGQATTLVAVIADVELSKAALKRVARMAQDGLARAVYPCHTLWDGDIVFAAATGGPAADPSRVGVLAGMAVETAVRRSVR